VSQVYSETKIPQSEKDVIVDILKIF